MKWALVKNGIVENLIEYDGVTPYNPVGFSVEQVNDWLVIGDPTDKPEPTP